MSYVKLKFKKITVVYIGDKKHYWSAPGNNF